MSGISVDEERKERLVFDKRNIYCESVRRSIEVLAHAIPLTFQKVKGEVTAALSEALEGKVKELNSALAELK